LVVPDPVRPTAQLTPAETGSGGLAVETHVLARLLGVKLLTLEGVVLISPAQVSRNGVDEPPARLPVASIDGGRNRQSAGTGLGDAARLLDECTEELRALDAARVATD
jgi:hypothetical protein